MAVELKEKKLAVFAGLDRALRVARVERGLAQVEVARRAGVTQSMLSAYEGGREVPRLSTLDAILAALGMNLTDLGAALGEEQPLAPTRGGADLVAAFLGAAQASGLLSPADLDSVFSRFRPYA